MTKTLAVLALLIGAVVALASAMELPSCRDGDKAAIGSVLKIAGC